MTASDLLEHGIRAYTRGALDEAERCWHEALALDPGNDRARSYLDVLVSKARAHEPPAPAPARGAIALPRVSPSAAAPPVPLPPPAAAPPPRAVGGPFGPRPVVAAVPLPAPPGAPEWMRPPITLVPQPPAGSATAAPAPPGASAPAPGAEVAPARKDHISVTDYVASPWDDGPALAPAVVLDDGDGLDLASVDEQSGLRPLVPDSPLPAMRPHARPRSDVDLWMEGARELFALGDFSGSLEMIEKILKVDPHHTEARLYLEQNESTLTAMYESKLGPGDGLPRLAIGGEEVMWLNLDHRAGFLLAQIDGTVTYEDLFAVSGLPRLDTARILATLLQEGVITS